MRRIRTAILILLFFNLWPLFHMVTSLQVGFSPWRFAGWGMYAVPEPQYPLTNLIVVLGFREQKEQSFLRPVQFFWGVKDVTPMLSSRSSLYVYTHGLGDGGLINLRRPSRDVYRALRKIARRARTFRRPKDLSSLVRLLVSLLPPGLSSYDNLFLLVTDRRFNLKTGLSYTESSVLQAEGSSLRYIGKISSERKRLLATLECLLLGDPDCLKEN